MALPMILAILQARVSSSRLPGKVLKPLLGVPMMLRQIERVRRARRIDRRTHERAGYRARRTRVKISAPDRSAGDGRAAQVRRARMR